MSGAALRSRHASAPRRRCARPRDLGRRASRRQPAVLPARARQRVDVREPPVRRRGDDHRRSRRRGRLPPRRLPRRAQPPGPLAGADAPGMGHKGPPLGGALPLRRAGRNDLRGRSGAATLERRAGDSLLTESDCSQPRAEQNACGHDPVHLAAGSRSGRCGPDRHLVRTGTSGQSAGWSSRSPARSSTSSRAPRTDASQSAVCHDSRSLRRYQRPHRQRRCRRAGTKGGRRWRSNREV